MRWPLMFKYTHETKMIPKELEIKILKGTVTRLNRKIDSVGFSRNPENGRYVKS